MNKLSKEKRDRLLLICIGVAGIVGVLYFFVFADMKDEHALLGTKITSLRDKINKSEKILKKQSDFQTNLEQLRKTLNERQAQMPRPGEDHVWFLRIMEDRRTGCNVVFYEI